MSEGKKKTRIYGKRWAVFSVFIVPPLLVYVAFVIYPLFSALGYSLYQWNGILRGPFVGLQNFYRLLTLYPYNELVWNAFYHNVEVFVSQIVFRNGLALLLAVLVVSKLKGVAFFRTLFFIPKVLPAVVVGFLWTLILNSSFGVVNNVMRTVGLGGWAKAWLGDPALALPSIMGVDLWYWIGFYIIIYVAGLQSIPADFMEAALIDGAGPWTRFWRITFPLLMPSITIVTVLTFVQSFQLFDLIFGLTGSSGQPYHSTDVLALMFYRISFGEGGGGAPQDIGLGSALAVLMFLLIFGVAAFITSILRKREVSY